MLRLAFDFIITWRETRTRPNAYGYLSMTVLKELFDVSNSDFKLKAVLVLHASSVSKLL